MKSIVVLGSVAASCALALSACSAGSSPGSGPASAGTSAPPASGSSGASSGGSSGASSGGSSPANAPAGSLRTAHSSLGTIVVDGKGRTVYYFTKDTPGSGKSACVGPCLTAWPPVLAKGATAKGSGVTAKLGTIELPDHTFQVTVDKRPVYLFAKDTMPGAVSGQGVGQVWYVVAPDGRMLTGSGS